MNSKRIIEYLVKIIVHMILIGSRVKFIVVWSFGWEIEKGIAHQSVGNAGFVNLLNSVPLKPSHQALQKPIPIVHQDRRKH